MVLPSLVADFVEYLKTERNFSQKTIKNYDHYLHRFLEFAGNIQPFSIDLELIRKYRVYLSGYTDPETKKPLKKITQNYFMIALRAFLRYLDYRGIKTISAGDVQLKDQDPASFQILNEEDITKLLLAPDVTLKDGLRDRAIIETLYSTGLLVSELASLNCDQINLQDPELVVIGKGGKKRSVFLSDNAREWLGKYLMSRKDYFKPLFIRFQGRKEPIDDGEKMRLTPRSIERMVEKYTKLAGFSIKVTPHTLRHSFAASLLAEGADIKSAQELLGHSHVSTTQIYTKVPKKSRTSFTPSR